MATFEVTAPNGKRYRVVGDSAEGAARAVQQMLMADQPSAEPIPSGQSPERSPRPAPRPSEADMARASALPPGTDPRTVPQAAPPLDPATMPAVPYGGDVPEGSVVIATTENGGRVMRGPDGALSYADNVMSTTDERDIMRILRGNDPGDVSQRAFSEDIVAQNPVASRVATAVTGVPLVGSYGDEIAGMAGAAGGESEAYRQYAEQVRDAGGEPVSMREWVQQNVQGSANAMDTAYPGQAAALRLAGTGAGAGVAAKALGPVVPQATTKGARFLRNMTLGGGAGAAEGVGYGLGEQEGPGRVQNAVVQGVLGGVLGVAGGALAAGIENHVMRQADRLRNRSVQAIQDELGVSPNAAQMIRRALEGGEADRAVKVLKERGPDAMLAEASPGLRILLNTQTKTDIGAGNIARNAISEQNAVRYGRLTETMDDVLGSPQGREFAEEGIMDATRAARQSAYGEAFDTPVDFSSPDGMELERILTKRMPRGVVDRANDALREAGEQSQILARIADDGSVSFKARPTTMQIDHMMRRLQDMEAEARRAGRTGDAIRYGNLRKEVRTILRRMIPAYGKALDAGADAIAKREALDLGARALSMPRSTLRFELRGASGAEKRFAAQGVREQIDDMMARAGAIASDPEVETREIRRVLQPLTSRQGRENLAEIIGPKETKRLLDAVEESRAGLELQAAVSRNSDTAITRNVNEMADELTGSTFLEAVSGVRPAEARDHIIHALSGDSEQAQQLRRAGLGQEIAQLLTGKSGAGAEKALDIIGKNIAAEGGMSPGEARLVALALTRLGILTAYPQSRLALAP